MINYLESYLNTRLMLNEDDLNEKIKHIEVMVYYNDLDTCESDSIEILTEFSNGS